MRSEILADLEHDASKYQRELIETIKEIGELGFEELRQSNAFALIELKYDELLKIEEALERIVKEAYGRCLEGRRRIGTERLKVVPHAIRCIDCQAAHERAERQKACPSA